MDDRLADAMARRTNAELIEIASSTAGLHEPEAIAAAAAELELRVTTTEDIREAMRLSMLCDREKQERARTPLEARWKLLAFLLPGIIHLLLAPRFTRDGYHRKLRDARTHALLGALLWIVCLLVIVVWMG